MCVLISSAFEFLSFIVSCVLFALLAVLCVILRGCMVFPLKVHGFRAVIEQTQLALIQPCQHLHLINPEIYSQTHQIITAKIPILPVVILASSLGRLLWCNSYYRGDRSNSLLVATTSKIATESQRLEIHLH